MRPAKEKIAMKRTAIVFAALLLTEPAQGFDTRQLGQVGSTDMEDLAPLVAKSYEAIKEVLKSAGVQW